MEPRIDVDVEEHESSKEGKSKNSRDNRGRELEIRKELINEDLDKFYKGMISLGEKRDGKNMNMGKFKIKKNLREKSMGKKEQLRNLEGRNRL